MRIAFLNVTATLSTGRIAAELCRTAQEMGHQTLLAFSRGAPPQGTPYLRVGNRLTPLWHGLCARLTDRSGFFSRQATRKLVRQLKAYRPDLIHLHNLHGYYLHLPTLCRYLAESGVPVVWTLHDCWAFTGHCAYYAMAGCDKWRSGCGRCPCRKLYPKSLTDQSRRNWVDKRALWDSLPSLTLVTPSEWLAEQAACSFLKKRPMYVIPNGIDLEVFHPCEDSRLLEDVIKRYGLERLGGQKMLLSVASTWEKRKGLEDCLSLIRHLPEGLCVVLVGLTEEQRELVAQAQESTLTEEQLALSREERAKLPPRVIGLPRTAFTRELVALYTAADLYLCLSHEETQGLTLLEALACGTQVLCYDATALPETVTPEVGLVVAEGDLKAVSLGCAKLCAAPRTPEACRARALQYDARRMWPQYVRLYEQLHGDC